jgi:hypothetical protein
LRRFASLLILLVAPAGCGRSTQLEAGAVLLDLSVGSGVSTPDELQIFVYDDTGTIWNKRVPESGALKPESATHLGTVLLQPGTTQGGLRVHVHALAASARVADGTLSIPAGSRGTFPLQLSSDVPADGDGDGVPDAIDDCPGVANERQGGCPGTMDGGGNDGGGTDGAGDASDAGDAAPGDGGGMDAFDCDASGACNRATGSTCVDSAQCRSSFCVDGVCCANACLGPCRSCNQPNNDGVCQPYAQGTNPAAECTGGTTCNGAGACGPAPGGPKANGELCSAGTECMSTFCVDGVCCNNSCTGACRTCETGSCANVTRKPDPPECYGTMICNAAAKCVLN